MVDPSPAGRARMLERLVAHVRVHGLPADASLRRFAAELGTSHRMLAYYFGSRDALLATVLATLRAEDQRTLSSTAADWGLRDAALAMWSYYTDPQQLAQHRAFFAVFALALQQPEVYQEFLDSLNQWVPVIADLAAADGHPPDEATTRAQLLVSATRGLLMDRLTAADQDRTDRAFTLLLDSIFRSAPRIAVRRRARARSS